ncbi:MAG: type II toxin-antitoxin system PemK/MazF family toxin [Armatimonadetes bacterium]|nr:type II toxin-antitoxin system PemK/MazF family toxin [Armatimonadota bacterium]
MENAYPVRGSVWQVRLDPVEGSEQGGTRPVLVISSDELNAALPVVTVAVITSRKTGRIFRTEVLIEAPDGGLPMTSKVLLYQVRTVSKSRLQGRMGQLSGDRMAQVEAAVRLALSV